MDDQEYMGPVKLRWDSSFEKVPSAVKVALTRPFLRKVRVQTSLQAQDNEVASWQ